MPDNVLYPASSQKRLRAGGWSPPCTVQRHGSRLAPCKAEVSVLHGATPKRESGTIPCTVQVRQGRAPVAMPVICLLNQKGGVGKTSTCHHLAGTLVRDQKTVLLVDNDPQSSLTQGFWGPMATREIDPAETVAAILGNEEP